MKKLPTEREVFEAIFARYYDEYVRFNDEPERRRTKVYVPLDLTAVARDLGCEVDVLFGSLYFHLDRKYRYVQRDGVEVNLFILRTPYEIHLIQFPYMCSILAGLRDEHAATEKDLRLSHASVVVSRISAAVAVIAAIISAIPVIGMALGE